MSESDQSTPLKTQPITSTERKTVSLQKNKVKLGKGITPYSTFRTDNS